MKPTHLRDDRVHVEPLEGEHLVGGRGEQHALPARRLDGRGGRGREAVGLLLGVGLGPVGVR